MLEDGRELELDELRELEELERELDELERELEELEREDGLAGQTKVRLTAIAAQSCQRLMFIVSLQEECSFVLNSTISPCLLESKHRAQGAIDLFQDLGFHLTSNSAKPVSVVNGSSLETVSY